MAVAASPPTGGIVAEVGGQIRPLVLRNREIERFEEQYDLGIYLMVERLCGAGGGPQARHVRDLVALGLIGAGMADGLADGVLRDIPASQNVHLRLVARDLLVTAFAPPEGEPEKPSGDGTRPTAPPETEAADTTSGASPETLSPPA